MQHGGDVNAADNIHQTPLHWAAVKGSIDVADLLLQNGARIEAADVNGFRVNRLSSFPPSVSVSVCSGKWKLLCIVCKYLG